MERVRWRVGGSCEDKTSIKTLHQGICRLMTDDNGHKINPLLVTIELAS